MMDLGGFISYAFPAEDVNQLRFARFPVIDPSMALYEDFSVDSIHIPSGAPNPEVAREFLVYFYAPENLKRYLDPEGNVPARTDVEATGNHMVEEAQRGLIGVAGTSQYYDRDTNPDVAQAGLKGFQEFMVHPDRADRILQDIERVRLRAYGAL